MREINFSSEYKDLVTLLCKTDESGNPPVFPTMHELMLFAAMLGKRENSSVEGKGVGGTVPTSAMSNADKDGVVYLLAMLEEKNPDILKGDAAICWKKFESYANGGMGVISSWISGQTELSGIVNELISRISEYARKTETSTGVKIIKKGRLKKITK